MPTWVPHAVKALHLNLLVGSNNQNDANAPELFDQAQIDRFVTYARAIGAEPLMIAPVYGNNVDGGPTSAQGAADLVTYVNGTKGYGVQYWTIGDEVDGYPQFFPNGGYTVTTAAQYCEVFKSYAEAMKAAPPPPCLVLQIDHHRVMLDDVARARAVDELGQT